MNELQKLAKEISNKYPQLLEQINELLDICYNEIENGGAEVYEVEECYDLIKKLVKTIK
jgi:DNA-directed RNA polymerase subunit K/omega